MTTDPTPAEIEAALALIREAMQIGLQDADLSGEGGRQRITEWADWIDQKVRAVLPDHDARVRADERRRVAEEIEAYRDSLARDGRPFPAMPAYDRCAAIARAHTTEGGTDA